MRNHHVRSQSAMEYLMTYGWAILIIAVVLGSLYQLGVFNASNYAPRAQPGGCKVFRPNGSGTTAYINLEGVCTGELPQYVAGFNGGSSYVDAGNGASLSPTNAITISAWVKISTASTTNNERIVGKDRSVAYTLTMETSAGISAFMFAANVGGVAQSPSWSSSTIPLNQWTHVVATFNGVVANYYMNGAAAGSESFSPTGSIGTTTEHLYIGYDPGGPYWFNGLISNVQIYNTSLDASEVQSLYAEGIGGAPQVLNNLVGWWPLNGNATDYSGNGNQGTPYSIMYTSSWMSGYQGH